MDRLSVRTQTALAAGWVGVLLGATAFAPDYLTRPLMVLSTPTLGLLIWSFDGLGRAALLWIIPLAFWNALAVYFAPAWLSLIMLFAGLAVTTRLIFGARRPRASRGQG